MPSLTKAAKPLLCVLLVAAALTWRAGAQADDAKQEIAIFAGGCFWCMESDFEVLPGVIDVVSGYTGGTTDNPTYGQVGSGGTGHYEAVRITYDPKQISYERLLYLFWRSVDPTDDGGQFCDRGETYKTAIFAVDAEQKKLADASKKDLVESKRLEDPIVTPVLDASKFWLAEDYHQDYYKTHSYRYKLYRFGCRRDKRIEELWGDEAHGGEKHS